MSGDNAAVGLLARMLVGLSVTGSSFEPDGADFGADIVDAGAHSVSSTIALSSGDTYRVTVEWLNEESP